MILPNFRHSLSPWWNVVRFCSPPLPPRISREILDKQLANFYPKLFLFFEININIFSTRKLRCDKFWSLHVRNKSVENFISCHNNAHVYQKNFLSVTQFSRNFALFLGEKKITRYLVRFRSASSPLPNLPPYLINGRHLRELKSINWMSVLH